MRSILHSSWQGREPDSQCVEPMAAEQRLPGCKLLLLLMASINSSGLLLPAHARSLQPVLGSKSLFLLPTHPPQTSSCSWEPMRTYTPSGFRLDTRGSGRVLGWLRSCLVLARGGESALVVGGKPTGWGKKPGSGSTCTSSHAYWAWLLQCCGAATLPSPGALEEKRLGPRFPHLLP